MTMEQPEAAPDLVGRTSARLLAAGIDRRDRLEALHLLAILDASIDTSGRVRRPLDDLAAEFELPPLSVMRSLDHLEHAGAVQRDGGGVLVLGASADGLGGLHLADFLDDVRASFDDAVPVRRRTTLFARGGAALAAAAAALAIITLAPSSGVQVPVALRDAGSTTTAADRIDAPPPSDAPAGADREIRPTTTIVAPLASSAADTDVLAATSPSTTCPATPTTTEPPKPSAITEAAEKPEGDLAACLEANGVVITGVTLAGPTIEARPPADPAPRADVLAPVDDRPAVIDGASAAVTEAPPPPTTDHIARTIRS